MAGIDLFDTAYPTAAAAAGRAFIFPTSPSPTRDHAPFTGAPIESPVSDGGQEIDAAPQAGKLLPEGELAFEIDLADTKQRLDKSPLLEGCECYACVHHSRGYLHHLLQSEELLVRYTPIDDVIKAFTATWKI